MSFTKLENIGIRLLGSGDEIAIAKTDAHIIETGVAFTFRVYIIQLTTSKNYLLFGDVSLPSKPF